MTNTELLENYIKNSGFKKGKLASALGISLKTFGLKIRGNSDFKSSEIQTLCSMLGIVGSDEKERVFFA